MVMFVIYGVFVLVSLILVVKFFLEIKGRMLEEIMEEFEWFV